MKQKVIDTILKYNLIQKRDSIVIGLSGGADSVCLALVLNEIKDEFDLSLKAVHINHQLRGKEADRDMNFCKEFCKKLNIPFVCYEIDVKAKAKDAKQGIEEYARRVRYECFQEECNGGKIATAHSLDDVAETMVFNIARGCSVKGLCSIPAKRDNIIRPLIDVSREEIEGFLKAKNQEFVTDSTNLGDEYTRNKIRHNVIPVLKEINPAFLRSVARLKESAFADVEFITNYTEKLPKVTQNALKSEQKAVVFEFISRFLEQTIMTSPDFFHIEKCYEVIKNGGRCQLPKGYIFSIKDGKPFVSKPNDEKFEEFEFELKETVKTPYNKYITKIISYEEYKNTENVYNLFLNTTIDYDRICHSLKLRNRRSGDRMLLKNRKVNKLLKSVYNELKIPVDIRCKLAVLEEEGKIIWAEGVGVADGYSPNKNTKRVLLIQREVDYH